jgi:phosphoribosylformylglycinamidine (FGAM) synthase-like enzyme
MLFGEDASRILISCDPAKVSRIQQIAAQHGIAADVLGETTGDRLEISVDGEGVVASALSDLKAAYESALQSVLRADAELMAAD